MTRKKTFLTGLAHLSPLIFVCIAAVALVAPTLQYNINDPNLIVYFGHDEGYRMDVIWKYYSGETRDSYQGDYEYGLLMVYLSDLARALPFDFTPGMFVLVIRWLHLLFWVLSLICLWRLVIYHFGSKWQAALCVIILATRPAFPYFLNTLKPDPIVLFFMIVGLDHTLRIIDHPSKRNLLIAIACSSLALIVKFSGIFLLPAIVIAMFLVKKYKAAGYQISPRFRAGWIFYSFAGSIFIFLPLAVLLFYVRSSTGQTWSEEWGLWGSLSQNKFLLYLIMTGVFFIFLSGALWLLNKGKKFKGSIETINDISSYALVVFAAFIGFTVLFGFRWILNPQLFIISYSGILPYTFGSATSAAKVVSQSGLPAAFFSDFIIKIKEFGLVVVILFIFYAVMEMILIKKNLKHDLSRSLKRSVLAGFIGPFLIFIFVTGTRMVQLHMLPFIAAMLILAFQGIKMCCDNFIKEQIAKKVFLGAVFIFIIADISFNGRAVVSAAINKYHQREDVIFELMKWWRENIPLETRVVADHHTRVYIPAEYKNIKIFKGYQVSRVEQLRNLVNSYRPRLVYYYAGPHGGEPLPPIDEMLPDKNVNLFKSFESEGRYQRESGGKFVIYEISY